VRISFDPDSWRYWIRDLGIGLGAYMRIEHGPNEAFVLTDNQIINVGSTLLLVSLMDSLDEENTPALTNASQEIQARLALAKSPNSRIPLLKIKVVGGPAYGQFFVRNPLDSSKQHVLGRVDDCDIFIDDKVMSKRHCTFQFLPGPAPQQTYDLEQNSTSGFNLNKALELEGSCADFAEGHWVLKDGYASASLNGTWAYLSQETPIRHKMTFKASEILFEANLSNHNQ